MAKVELTPLEWIAKVNEHLTLAMRNMIEGKKDLIKRMTTRMTEMIAELEDDIKSLEEQLKEAE